MPDFCFFSSLGSFQPFSRKKLSTTTDCRSKVCQMCPLSSGQVWVGWLIVRQMDWRNLEMARIRAVKVHFQAAFHSGRRESN